MTAFNFAQRITSCSKCYTLCTAHRCIVWSTHLWTIVHPVHGNGKLVFCVSNNSPRVTSVMLWSSSRLLELKEELVKLAILEYQYYDDFMADMKLVPVSYSVCMHFPNTLLHTWAILRLKMFYACSRI